MNAQHELEGLLESIPHLVWTTDKDGQTIRSNRRWVEYAGHSRAGGCWLEFLHPDSRESIGAQWAQALAAGGAFEADCLLRRPDGSSRWHLVRALPLRDPRGEISGWIGTGTDIHERKEAERRLQLAHERFQQLVESNVIGIVLADSQSILEANDAFLKIVGYSRAELTGRKIHWRDITPKEHHDTDQRALDKFYLSGACTPFEKEYFRKDGTRVPVLLGGATLTLEPFECVCFVLDLTRLKEAEERLRRTSRELARSNQALEQFAYVASHDLKEPLRMVSLFVQLLQRKYQDQLDDEAREYIHFAVDGATRMQTLIDDLLNYSRIGRNPQRGMVDCEEALDQAMANLKVTLDEAQLQLVRDPLPRLHADLLELVQLFQNLLHNAVKFRRESPVRIEIRHRLESGFHHFTVGDNGLGIEAKSLERIFVLFQRLHTRDRYPGTGIGLAVCKKIVESLGGSIWAESEPGKGSTFHFKLPG